MRTAEVTLHLVDATQLEEPIIALQPQELLVFNKIDLLSDHHALRRSYPEALLLSCKTGEGLEELKMTLIARITGSLPATKEQPSAFAINARHQACLQRAESSLNSALELFEARQPLELLAVELHASLQALGEIVGASDTEEILGEIFGNFCIGK
jgi:tRNA modification GTPase